MLNLNVCQHCHRFYLFKTEKIIIIGENITDQQCVINFTQQIVYPIFLQCIMLVIGVNIFFKTYLCDVITAPSPPASR